MPDDYIVVDQTKTKSSNYAGIVAEKNGTLPHFLVFSDKPVSDFTREDEDELYAFLGGIFPEVREVRKKEAQAGFEGGIAVDAAEWEKAPRLGLFPVREVQDRNHLYLQTGILREEA